MRRKSMTIRHGAAGVTAAELRRAFDRSFAELPSERNERFEDLLAITVAGAPFAMRLREIAGLFADKEITPLPSPVPELVGVGGFRGALVPVYDLRALLGYPASERSRWLVLTGSKVALAFDGFEGHLRVSLDAIAAEAPGKPSTHAREVVRAAGVTRPIVDVPSVLESISKRAQQQPQQQAIPQRER
jgi:chemotaxis signal transduction protein